MVKKIFPVNDLLKKLNDRDGAFVVLKLLAPDQKLLNENLYWLSGKDGEYHGLKDMRHAALKIAVETAEKGS